MLPEVGSTMTPPGASEPSRSACWIIASPMRSLTLLSGLSDSILPISSPASPSPKRENRTSGVEPTRSHKLLAIKSIPEILSRRSPGGWIARMNGRGRYASRQ
ncbi:MAG: hypothetical protein BWZ10_03235 [candidate division BRC1 bacterium ADurb.BinA364]|nr:MAG: hypothetical protein BWZ10_03235 [candidate division BRC1 bacterium ADurb.BinA364]